MITSQTQDYPLDKKPGDLLPRKGELRMSRSAAKVAVCRSRIDIAY
jgi:hypothetical protein